MPFRALLQASALVFLTTVSACGGDSATKPDPTGSIAVTLTTTGSDQDSDGYTLKVGSTTRAASVNGTVTFAALPVGSYSVEVSEVAVNCLVAEPNPVQVLVTDGGSTPVTFQVDCSPLAATIDGVRSGNEWNDATAVATQDPNVTLYYKNDTANLYLALEVRNDPLSADDWFTVRFDNTRDGPQTAGEDDLAVYGDGTFFDRHFNGSAWAAPDTQVDGTGAAGSAGGVSFFEMSHPLNSGDSNDFSLAPGGSVGFCLILYMNGTGGDNTTLPRACQRAPDQSGYLEMVLR